MEKAVLFSVEKGIATITLNRPDRHNSFNQELLALLYDAVEEVGKNPDIRVAVLTGNGKSFCSGIDLQAIATDNLFDPRGDGKEMPDHFWACDTPIIGAINGAAITGGFELALNCDFLIASEKARFGDTHAKVGIHPGWGMTQLLQQAVGQRRAKQMSLTCQYIDAQRAYDWGLVNEVVAPEQLMPRAMELAEQICQMNQDMQMNVKKLIETQNSMHLMDAYRNERKGFYEFVNRMKVGMGKS